MKEPLQGVLVVRTGDGCVDRNGAGVGCLALMKRGGTCVSLPKCEIQSPALLSAARTDALPLEF